MKSQLSFLEITIIFQIHFWSSCGHTELPTRSATRGTHSVIPTDRDDRITSRTESALGLALGAPVTHAQGMLPLLLHWHAGSTAFKSVTSISTSGNA